MEGPLFIANNIAKKRSGGFTLEISHLEFRAGKIYSIIGPNGAGKSTLLRILNLLEEPDKGEILFNDEKADSSNVLNIRRRMGMVMENPYLFHTTVFKNIASGLKFRSIDRNMWEPMVKEALELVGLEGFENRYATELSRGESQRVAIARTLVLKPKILFLDEPFTNIDKRNSAILEELIKAINGGYETTVIFTTHDLIQAYHLADEVISLVDGRLIIGSLENLFSGEVADSNGLQSVTVSPKVSVTVSTIKSGKVRISVPPQDIILSLHPLESSARNSFEGIIKKIHLEGQTVRAFVEVDKGVEFVAMITKSSYDKMNFIVDSHAFLTFKSSSVTVF